MSYTNIYRNVEHQVSEGSRELLKKQRGLSVHSDIYLQAEEGVYEPVRGSEKEEPKEQCGSYRSIREFSGAYLQEDSMHQSKRDREKSKYKQHRWSNQQTRGSYQRSTVLIAALAIGLIVILYLILLSCGLAKYSAMVSEREALQKELKKAETLGSFLIYNEAHNKCAEVLQLNASSSVFDITASPCSPITLSQFFRWIPKARLLNVEAGLCLGALTKPASRLAVKLLPCHLKGALSWVCTNETLLGPHKQQVYFNYGNSVGQRVIFWGGIGIWSRWKAWDLEEGLQEGGVCPQISGTC
ncbi:uncharacterized protein O3C94_009112 [Discoglossus pictus]